MPLSPATTSDLVAKIRQITNEKNRNNVTRTDAYLRYYRENPEVEWALLAHLVSRNGGWNMTDLQGDVLSRFLDEESIEAYFHFMERCNWLIFHDAYAQLLLYREMKKSGDDLTSLLPLLGVSRFMQPIWQHFRRNGNRLHLTHALIINEQQYIEQRVIMKPFYQREVLESLPFQLQSLLSLNQVLFPYGGKTADEPLRLAGISVHRFASLEQRIHIGKSLYHLLVHDSARLRQFVEWATRTPHTGSRADYWPDTFSHVRKPDCLYSPWLTRAWPDVSHQPADGVDWFTDERWWERLNAEKPLPFINETDYRLSLNILRTASGLAIPFSQQQT